MRAAISFGRRSGQRGFMLTRALMRLAATCGAMRALLLPQSRRAMLRPVTTDSGIILAAAMPPHIPRYGRAIYDVAPLIGQRYRQLAAIAAVYLYGIAAAAFRHYILSICAIMQV